MVKQIKKPIKCPDCVDSLIIDDSKTGFSVCTECGITVNRIIDEGSEWRTFTDTTDPSRVGSSANPLLDVEQLDTLISNSALARVQLKNLMRGPERNLLNAFNLIQLYCDRATIPTKVSDQAKLYYKDILQKKITKGKNLEAVVAACLYLSCKKLHCARTFKEISLICQIPKEEIGKMYKLIEKEYGVSNTTTEDIIERFCSHLSLNMKEQKVALLLSKRVRENGLVPGKSPVSIAAAILYMTCWIFNKKRCKEICVITKVSEVTVKNTYKELILSRDLLILEDEFPQGVIESLSNA